MGRLGHYHLKKREKGNNNLKNIRNKNNKYTNNKKNKSKQKEKKTTKRSTMEIQRLTIYIN
jgi:hypothetical protein